MAEKRTEMEKPALKKWTASKLIAFGILFIDAISTYYAVPVQTCHYQYLHRLFAVPNNTDCGIADGFKKAAAENTKGGITYDTAMKTASNLDANDL